MADTLWSTNATLDASLHVYDSASIIYDSATVTYDGIDPTLITPELTLWAPPNDPGGYGIAYPGSY